MTAVQFIFGWPLALGSISLMVGAILLRSPWMAIAGVAAAVPFGLYVAAFGATGVLVALAILSANVGYAVALRGRKVLLAAALLIPYAGLLLYVARVAAGQSLD